MKVELPARDRKLLEKLVKTGRYGDAAGVMGRALRTFQAQELEVQRLRAKLQLADRQVKAGQVVPLERVRAELRQRRTRRARGRAA